MMEYFNVSNYNTDVVLNYFNSFSLNGTFNEYNATNYEFITQYIQRYGVFQSIYDYLMNGLIIPIYLVFQRIFQVPNLLDSIVRVLLYLFSNYAAGLIISYIFINRLIVMSSLRSNTNKVVLPKSSKWLLHLSAIVPLLYLLLQSLTQINFVKIEHINALHTDVYLPMTFALLLYSQCIEFFYNFTTNSKLLEKNDNSTLELSLQLYTMNASYALFQKQSHGFISLDIDFIIIDRIGIHIIELFGLRRYRLLENSAVNITQLLALLYESSIYGILSIPFYTLFKCSTKIISLFTILLIFTIQCLKWFVEYLSAPFINLIKSTQNSTINKSPIHLFTDIRKNLYYDPEQEFISFLYNLLLLTCNGGNIISTDTDSFILRGEELLMKDSAASKTLHIPELNNKFMVSGYLNELSTIPDDLILSSSSANTLPAKNSKNLRGISSSIIVRIKMIFTIVKKLCLSFMFFGYHNNNLINHTLKNKKPTNKKSKDLNLYITEKNYTKFLTRPADDANNKYRNYLLLPDEDVTRDFDLELFQELNDKYNKDKHIKYEYLKDDPEELKEELVSILIPDNNEQPNSSHLPQIWEGIATNMRLTRSQFGSRYPERVFEQTVLERRQFCQTLSQELSDPVIDEYEEEEQYSTLCLICRFNKRSIILWPCRCLSCCDMCRDSLGHKGFQKCFTCDSEVNGYSIVHNV
ncbi:hypothetical protein TPHA_0G02290 [Tetrapisispora phaffii CBS 4417]|uniref:RING-type domain-containing protein n=1 Tax=Tetrapisispora phaffii (strain ATCC 24235 / CBS 4417 / NBRC 1672 / NRRL Y-8282 / UCD 70-5) TaxID=1071381 RepID=G8BVY7_TETPH|nr:hypothetical protein TPHA_0G02290 [Tetrapisispora phaffii CBS 4417]CCE64065.1 hypothetical protein TPHA_0G02290 [Tetrapisispora phaffii CBS 4417]